MDEPTDDHGEAVLDPRLVGPRVESLVEADVFGEREQGGAGSVFA
jgi:hypothetical protein